MLEDGSIWKLWLGSATVRQFSGVPSRACVPLYYQEELNLKEIGAVLEVGESRVSQLHSQAIKRLRTKLGKL